MARLTIYRSALTSTVINIKIALSEITGLIEVKCWMEHPIYEATRTLLYGPGHVTKMVARHMLHVHV